MKSLRALCGIALTVLGCSGATTPGNSPITPPGASTGQSGDGSVGYVDASYVPDTSTASHAANVRVVWYDDVPLSELPPVPPLVNQGGGAFILGLGVGEPSPWPSVAFNTEAISALRVGWSAQNQRCDIQRRAAVDEVAARARRDLLLVGAEADLEHTTLRLSLTNQTSRVSELERISQRLSTASQGSSTFEVVLYSLGAFVVGGVGSWVVYSLTQ